MRTFEETKKIKGRTRGLQGSVASEEHEPMSILWDLFTVGEQFEGGVCENSSIDLKKNIKILFFLF